MMDEPDTRARFARMYAALQAIPPSLPERPKAVLVVSGHWEEAEFTVGTSAAPGMVFDYYGFPEHTYRIKYAAPGSPEVAQRVVDLGRQAGIVVRTDAERGFDHGTFSMLQPMYPDADVPVVQLAMKANMDPAQHFALGKALAPLRDEGVLILGSGQSYHNLRRWNTSGRQASIAFDGWLRDVLLRRTGVERERALEHWEEAPSARVAHPREEHLIPLMVVAGAAAEEPATVVYGEDFFGALHVSSFRFGSDTTATGFDDLGVSAR